MGLKEKLRNVLKNPKRALREINRLWHRRFYLRPYNTDGVDVFEEDWDNLIILDACRYDLFRDKIDTSEYGEFSSGISRGSSTYEFTKANFFGKDLTDTVYVTANGHIFWMEDELDEDVKLHDRIMVEKGEGDEKEGTILASTVRKKAEEVAEKYGDKRLIIHFVQPHYPFVGYDKVESGIGQFWDKVFDGEIDNTAEELWRGYSKNLERAWPEVETLIEELDGKTVITSDHGNMFGERASPVPVKEFGHPQGIYTEELVKVPWLEIDGERRDINKGSSKGKNKYKEEEIKNQLENLGYGGEV